MQFMGWFPCIQGSVLVDIFTVTRSLTLGLSLDVGPRMSADRADREHFFSEISFVGDPGLRLTNKEISREEMYDG
jgi:hypothetical protein